MFLVLNKPRLGGPSCAPPGTGAAALTLHSVLAGLKGHMGFPRWEQELENVLPGLKKKKSNQPVPALPYLPSLSSPIVSFLIRPKGHLKVITRFFFP